MFRFGLALNRQRHITPPETPTPTITVSASAASVDEGDFFVLTIETTNYSGSTVNYTITGAGITVEDTDWETEGYFDLVDGSAEIEVGVTPDETTEGSETMTITVMIPDTAISDSVEIVINDTSITPVPFTPASIASAIAEWDFVDHVELNGGTIATALDQIGAYDLAQSNAASQPTSAVDGAQFTATKALIKSDAVFSPGTADFWLAGKFKTSSAVVQVLLTNRNKLVDGNNGILFLFDSGILTLYSIWTTAPSLKTVATVSTYNDGNFHAFVATCDRNGNMKLYIGSEELSVSISHAASDNINITNPFIVGAEGNFYPTLGNGFIGTIDGLAWGKGGLPTSQEITDLLEYYA